MSGAVKRVLVLGSVPPPVGGVTASVSNELESLREAGVEATLVRPGARDIARAAFRRFDLAHVHASSPRKRFLGMLAGRLLARKAIFTLHGRVLRLDSWFERLSLWLADGAVILNEDVATAYREAFDRRGVKRILLTPLFSEGFDTRVPDERFFHREAGRKYLLLYAYAKVEEDGHDLYGVDFIMERLAGLGGYRVVLLDPKAHYREEVARLGPGALIHIDHPVHFKALLKNVDAYIRPTYSDGNSVAIQEAIFLRVPVLASDKVQRPAGAATYRYGDFDDFLAKLRALEAAESPELSLSSVRDLLAFAEEI